MRRPVLFLLPLLAAQGCKWGNDFKIPPPSTSRLPTAQDQPSYDAMNGVAFKLAAQMAPSDGSNMVFSPVGAGQDLLMLMAGSSNKAYNELVALMRANEDNKQDYYDGQRALLNRLGSIPDKPFKVGSALFTVWPIVLDKKYAEKMGAAFGSPVRKLGAAGIESTRLVNEWASMATDGKIDKLIDKLDRDKPLLLMSLGYFDSVCLLADAGLRPFRTDYGAVSAPSMSARGTFGIFEDASIRAVGIPCHGDDFTLVVLLPGANMTAAGVLRSMSAERWVALRTGMKQTQVTVTVPRLELDEGSDLTSAVAASGCPSLFTNDCDLRPMSIEMERGFQVSSFVHRAVMKIRPTGATNGVKGAGAVFTADVPFVYVLTENKTGVVCMVGLVNDPTKP